MLLTCVCVLCVYCVCVCACVWYVYVYLRFMYVCLLIYYLLTYLYLPTTYIKWPCHFIGFVSIWFARRNPRRQSIINLVFDLTCKVIQGRNQKISKGVSIKGPSNLTYPHFQNHSGFRPVFFQKGLLASQKFCSFFEISSRRPNGPPLTTSLVILLSSKIWKGSETPEDILDRFKRTHATHILVRITPQKRIALWNKKNLETCIFSSESLSQFWRSKILRDPFLA